MQGFGVADRPKAAGAVDVGGRARTAWPGPPRARPGLPTWLSRLGDTPKKKGGGAQNCTHLLGGGLGSCDWEMPPPSSFSPLGGGFWGCWKEGKLWGASWSCPAFSPCKLPASGPKEAALRGTGMREVCAGVLGGCPLKLIIIYV